MEWDHKWGSHLKTLIDHAEKTKRIPKSIEDAPQPLPWAECYWEAFKNLTRYRPLYPGFGVLIFGAIPLDTVIAWLDERMVVDPVERAEWVEIVTALDDHYLSLVNDVKP